MTAGTPPERSPLPWGAIITFLLVGCALIVGVVWLAS
jgi:hypothetical protein